MTIHKREESAGSTWEENVKQTLNRRTALKFAVGVTAALALGGAVLAQAKAQIAMVVKIGGIPWFNAMEVGIKKVGAELGVDAWKIGPTQADAAQQVRAVEDLIARKVECDRRGAERCDGAGAGVQARPGSRHQGHHP